MFGMEAKSDFPSATVHKGPIRRRRAAGAWMKCGFMMKREESVSLETQLRENTFESENESAIVYRFIKVVVVVGQITAQTPAIQGPSSIPVFQGFVKE